MNTSAASEQIIVSIGGSCAGAKPTPRPASFWLRWLVLACIVPSWMLAVGVSYTAYQRERSALTTAALSAAQNLIRATEQELSSSLALLQILAQAPAIDTGDYGTLHAELVEAKRVSSAFNVFVVGRDMQALSMATVAQGLPLRPLPVDRFPALWSGARPDVSNVFTGTVDPVRLVGAAAPAVRNGVVKALVEMVFPLDRFARIIEDQHWPAGWTGGLVDRSRVFVAHRTQTLDAVGQSSLLRLEQQMAGGADGCGAVRAPDSTPSTRCFSASPRFGWIALVDVPDAMLEAALRRSLLEYSMGALVLLLAAQLLANRMGRSITDPVKALVPPALAIGRGAPARIEPLGLKEANEVAFALQQAQQLLAQRNEARERAETMLRDSESRLRLALEAGEVGDWEFDLRSGEIVHSLRHDQCFGYSEPVADWTLARFMAQVHPDDRRTVAAAQIRAGSSGTYHVECRVLWSDGSVHWLVFRGALIAEGGIATRAIGVVIDVTNRRQVEEMRLRAVGLEAANRQAQEASRLKSEFLSNMSHELRTPLNAVIGFADILLGRTDSIEPAKQRRFLGHIASSGRHLLGLINDLLDLSKVEAGKMEFRPALVQLPRLANEVIAMMQPEADRRGVVLSSELDPGLLEVELDPARLSQVLYNFLSNAVKFTQQGGRVVLRTRAIDAVLWRLEVEDTGVGISEADQARLFMPFQQIHAGISAPQAGTGLGLSLTRQLVELQGGSVGLRSAPGVGSVFHAVLPRRMAGTEDGESTRPAR